MLDNIADLLLTVSLLSTVFGFPTAFALQNMVPGTAIGVLVGDLLFFAMALMVARRLGRSDITAMPLGLDTPSTFGMVLFVLGPAFIQAKVKLGIMGVANPDPELLNQAARYAWHIGICSIVISGLFKFLCALGSNWVRRVVPRAGLLGSLTAVALVLISFMPLLELLHFPVAGLASLAVIITTLVAKVKFPWRIPGALGALLVGCLLYYLMSLTGTLGEAAPSVSLKIQALGPTGWMDAFTFAWVNELKASLEYMPIVIPFALGTVVGGIDCTESAAAAGDEFNTGQVIGVEAFATLVAGLCGGVIQTTPYIGHPAYKAMGGRAAYVLATALFVGGAGLIGYFELFYALVPKAAVFGILIFIGLEITAQSFQATPGRHYPAVALACVPALAALVGIFLDGLQGEYSNKVASLNDSIAEVRKQISERDYPNQAMRELVNKEIAPALDKLEKDGKDLEKLAGNPAKNIIGDDKGMGGKNRQTVRMLGAGFIVTSLLWASALAAIIDKRFMAAAAYLGVCAVCSLTGIMHSPLPGSPLVNPFNLPGNLPHTAYGQTPIYMAASYAVMVALLIAWDKIKRDGATEEQVAHKQ